MAEVEEQKCRSGSKVSAIANIFQPKHQLENSYKSNTILNDEVEEVSGQTKEFSMQATVVRTESHITRFNNARALFEKLGEVKKSHILVDRNFKCNVHEFRSKLNLGNSDSKYTLPVNSPRSHSPLLESKEHAVNSIANVPIANKDCYENIHLSFLHESSNFMHNANLIKHEKYTKENQLDNEFGKSEKLERRFNSKELIEKQKNWTSHFSKARSSTCSSDINKSVMQSSVNQNTIKTVINQNSPYELQKNKKFLNDTIFTKLTDVSNSIVRSVSFCSLKSSVTSTLTTSSLCAKNMSTDVNRKRPLSISAISECKKNDAKSKLNISSTTSLENVQVIEKTDFTNNEHSEIPEYATIKKNILDKQIKDLSTNTYQTRNYSKCDTAEAHKLNTSLESIQHITTNVSRDNKDLITSNITNNPSILVKPLTKICNTLSESSNIIKSDNNLNDKEMQSLIMFEANSTSSTISSPSSPSKDSKEEKADKELSEKLEHGKKDCDEILNWNETLITYADNKRTSDMTFSSILPASECIQDKANNINKYVNESSTLSNKSTIGIKNTEVYFTEDKKVDEKQDMTTNFLSLKEVEKDAITKYSSTSLDKNNVDFQNFSDVKIYSMDPNQATWEKEKYTVKKIAEFGNDTMVSTDFNFLSNKALEDEEQNDKKASNAVKVDKNATKVANLLKLDEASFFKSEKANHTNSTFNITTSLNTSVSHVKEDDFWNRFEFALCSRCLTCCLLFTIATISCIVTILEEYIKNNKILFFV